MEDYKKKYYDLIDRLRKATGDNNVNDERYCCVITDIVPELKESEDERIRKAIHIYLDWLDGRKDYAPKGEYSIKDMIAWLNKQEKQSVQKPQRIISAEVKEAMYDKPVWSEEDEYMLSLTSELLNYHPQCRKWLKSLKGRVQQPKQEWSEADEKNLKGIIAEIKANKIQAPDYDRATYDRFLSWLKSLRPQNRWKPSDEQLEALRIAAEIGTANNSWAMDVLKCVYQYLKKLREE